jgi:hypothetical protein
MKQQILHVLAKCPQLQHHLQPHQFTDFCRQLDEFDEVLDAPSAQELLDLFCLMYWRLDELQKSCFEAVSSVWLNASRSARVKIIPQLVEKSKICNNLLFSAQTLIGGLSSQERQNLDKLYPIHWTKDDEYTSITAEEYEYRRAKGLKCWIYKYPYMPNGKITTDYRRPCCANDIKCFYASLEILHLSGQESYMFMNGFTD